MSYYDTPYYNKEKTNNTQYNFEQLLSNTYMEVIPNSEHTIHFVLS